MVLHGKQAYYEWVTGDRAEAEEGPISRTDIAVKQPFPRKRRICTLSLCRIRIVVLCRGCVILSGASA